MPFDTDSLYTFHPNIEARWINPENPDGRRSAAGSANAGRKGSPCYGKVAAGETRVIADVDLGPGVIRHIWTTIENRSPKLLRGLRVDIYWDGADTPAVSAPWGDLFGLGLGEIVPFESALFTNPEGRNFNAYVPMPFRKGFKLTVTNETDTDLNMFWMQIDLTVGDPLPDDLLYFHAHWRRENPTSLKQDYAFLPTVKGRGRFLGVNFGVIVNTEEYKSWWGEGEVKMYLDGDDELPTLCGTGTEDYIGTSWGQGAYANQQQGCPIADEDRMRYAFYRYHLSDPIYFRESIRATIQQIGCWDPDGICTMAGRGTQLIGAGEGMPEVDMNKAAQDRAYGLFERRDDWSSCSYFYLDRPTNDLPGIQPLAERLAGLDMDRGPGETFPVALPDSDKE